MQKHCVWCGAPTPATYWCSDECEWEWREEWDLKDAAEETFFDDDFTPEQDLAWEEVVFD